MTQPSKRVKEIVEDIFKKFPELDEPEMQEADVANHFMGIAPLKDRLKDEVLTTLTQLEAEKQQAVEECIKVVEKEYIIYPETGKVQENDYNYALLNAVNSLKKTLTT